MYPGAVPLHALVHTVETWQEGFPVAAWSQPPCAARLHVHPVSQGVQPADRAHVLSVSPCACLWEPLSANTGTVVLQMLHAFASDLTGLPLDFTAPVTHLLHTIT